MLRIFRKLQDLRFSDLAELYCDSRMNDEDCLASEQDFYFYLKSCFFTDRKAFYAVWEDKGSYVAALRMEPYKNGLLLAGLQTQAGKEGKGYATILVQQTLAYLADGNTAFVYSHVEKSNKASVRVHEKCGFSVFSDSATFIDGSFSSNARTYLYKYEN